LPGIADGLGLIADTFCPVQHSSLLFDLNGEASTARTNQINAIIAPH
jgi:hypothetical protein